VQKEMLVRWGGGRGKVLTAGTNQTGLLPNLLNETSETGTRYKDRGGLALFEQTESCHSPVPPPRLPRASALQIINDTKLLL